MKKDFQSWHKEKSQIHDEKERPFFHEREIWAVSVGVNIGFEIDGKGEKFLRPIMVVKKFNNESFWAISLSKTSKKGKYYFSFKFTENVISTANLSQLRLIDSKRLQYKMGDINVADFVKIKEKLKQLLA